METKEEQLDIAKNTSCEKTLHSLHDSKYMNVRRAVARNPNISDTTVNILLRDPVLNVSYMASKNSKCSENRDFSKTFISECVLCEDDERYLDCVSCERKN